MDVRLTFPDVPTPDPTSDPTSTATSRPCHSFYIKCATVGSPSAALAKRCLAPTQELEVARLTYRPSANLVVGDDLRYAVTLAPRSSRIGGSSASSQDFAVTCTVLASLGAAESKLDVSPGGTQQQRYLPPEPTVFSWIVSARKPGSLAATLTLQPVMRIENGQGDVEDFKGRVEPVDVTFKVTPAASADDDDSVAERTGGFLKNSWNLVVSLATGVAAIAGCVTALHQLRKRRRRLAAATDNLGQEPDPAAGSEPPDQVSSRGTRPAGRRAPRSR